MRLKTPEKRGFMPENQLLEGWLMKPEIVSLLKQRPEGTEHCSGTRRDQQDLKVTLELKLRLWLKGQRQRTVQRANVNLR